MSPPSPDSSAGGPQLLVILRHSEAESFAAEDQQRRLTERGRGVSVADGEWLATRGIVPTHAFVSSAVRARETWAGVAEGSGSVAEPRIEDNAYTADTDTAVDLLRTVLWPYAVHLGRPQALEQCGVHLDHLGPQRRRRRDDRDAGVGPATRRDELGEDRALAELVLGSADDQEMPGPWRGRSGGRHHVGPQHSW